VPYLLIALAGVVVGAGGTLVVTDRAREAAVLAALVGAAWWLARRT